MNACRLVKRCNKPDRKEFLKVARLTAMGFLATGVIGFIVKVIFIPVNQASVAHAHVWVWTTEAVPDRPNLETQGQGAGRGGCCIGRGRTWGVCSSARSTGRVRSLTLSGVWGWTVGIFVWHPCQRWACTVARDTFWELSVSDRKAA